MSPEQVTAWVEAAKTGGPYTVAVVLGLALYWRDKQLRELYDRLLRITEAQTQAAAKLDATIHELMVRWPR